MGYNLNEVCNPFVIMIRKLFIVLLTSSLFIVSAYGDLMFHVYNVSHNKPTTTVLGTITLAQSAHGVIITPAFSAKLPKGIHGLRLVPSKTCLHVLKNSHDLIQPTSNEGINTKDFLPPLISNSEGKFNEAIIAPNKTLDDFRHHVLIIYQNSQEYPDQVFPFFSGTIGACAQSR